MMLHLDNAPKRATRVAMLVGALIFTATTWADPADTDPDPCSQDPEPATSASGDPSSFAAGCGAKANGDGSIAIGHAANVSGTETLTDYKLSSTSFQVTRKDPVIHAHRFSDPNSTNVDYVFADQDVNDALAGQRINATVVDLLTRGLTDAEYKDILDWLKVNRVDIRPTYDQAVANLGLIDVGAVVGTEGQAIVIRKVPAPATNGIAIGNGATVTGDNGIAIGADVEAGENQIVIGTEAHSATIAGVDIKQARTDINTNTTEIGVNRSRITNNTARIDTNANGIAANNMAIVDLNDRLMGVDERVKQVAAMSAALSAVPNAVSGDGDFFLGVGFGNSGGEQGIAVGVSARFGAKKNIVVNAGAASAGDETSVRAGVGFVW